MSYFQRAPDDYSCDFPNCKHDFDTDENRSVAAIKDEKIMVFCDDHCICLSNAGVKLRTIEEVQRVLILNRELSNEHDELTVETEFIRELKMNNY
jgi:hypothetical protein